jgi:hypothetical protein
VNNFLSSTGPRTVYFTYQPELREGPGGELVPVGGKLLTVGDKLSALVDEAAKALYFVRVAQGDVTTKTPEQDICSGEANQEGLECFQSTLQVLLPPVLRRTGPLVSPKRGSRASAAAHAGSYHAVHWLSVALTRRCTALRARVCTGAVRAGARKYDSQDVGCGKAAGH